MDRIRQLEKQIYDLQHEIEKQNREAEKWRQNQSAENLRRLQEYQIEMQNNLNRHDKEVQRKYERLLVEYQNSANEEIQKQQLQMNAEYQKLLADVKQKEKEWQEKNRQLKTLIDELKSNERERERVSSQEADKYIRAADSVYKEIEKKPHEKFFPERVRSLYNNILDAGRLLKHGLNEAAIAVSISVQSGLKRLGYEVDEKYEEWKRQWFIFAGKVQLQRMKLDDDLLIWRDYSNSHLRDEEIKVEADFWARGEYGGIDSRLSEFEREILKAEDKGIDIYIKDKSSINLDELNKYIEELERMSEKFENVSEAYKERYSASCQRAEWGEALIEFFEDEINLVFVENDSRFKPIEEERNEFVLYMRLKYGGNYEKTDIREWLELAFDNSMKSRIYIYIIPYEINNKVENRIVVYINHSGVKDEGYAEQIRLHIKEGIDLEEDGVIEVATDIIQLTAGMNVTLREAGKSLEKKIKKSH